ncbi:MAG TPA: helical backbone metal receptor [Bacillota bacterium]|jgi:iron complex transport system substrate-binding protein|nr:helical backbone metal receptor [Peptococcaceae bacterium MAG4]NLW37288.1 ABC transporter substrate-binding protein [Peptococcaceae bacterium]HPZ44080.1 helical backbone metal receptor [Bacillota bacterium]HQD76598.1 helical backbone metal receptor [Bacillota bacterium]HUM59306.1 helical backbone metal receptor [Bacillota bacterium]
MSRVRRIVSLVPSFTEIVYFLGLGGRLAGVTEHCDYPGEARTRAKVGTFGRPLPARILSLKPDLVLADAVLHRPWVTELRNAGLEVLARSLASVEDVFGVMDRIVQLCGVEDTGRERINSLREKVEQLRRAASRKRPRVFCLMRTDPVITPGPGSFQYDALEIAGARLMVFQTQEPYVEVSPEQIVAFDPEVVVFCGVEKGERKPPRCQGCVAAIPICQRTLDDLTGGEWEQTTAFRERRVYPIPCHTICRPGPRLIDGMERLHRIFSNL